MFKKVRADVQNRLVKVEIVRVQGGGVAQSQEEEHARDEPLIPGKILGGHAGLLQIFKGRDGVHPVVELPGIVDGGVAVGKVDLHGAAELRFHLFGDLQKPVPQAEEDLVGEGPQAETDDLLTAMYDSMAETLTDEQRTMLLKRVEDYEAKNGVTTKTTALKKKIKKTATVSEKDDERKNVEKAIDKAMKNVDYTLLQKEGSYTKSVEVNGKRYTVELKDNGIASCNGVEKEFE